MHHSRATLSLLLLTAATFPLHTLANAPPPPLTHDYPTCQASDNSPRLDKMNDQATTFNTTLNTTLFSNDKPDTGNQSTGCTIIGKNFFGRVDLCGAGGEQVSGANVSLAITEMATNVSCTWISQEPFVNITRVGGTNYVGGTQLYITLAQNRGPR